MAGFTHEVDDVLIDDAAVAEGPSTARRFTNFLQEYSIPLIIGVVASLVAANVAGDWYHHVVHFQLGSLAIFGHPVTVHFLINDIFMVFFFGIAAKEITESVLPGGDLNPPSKAINPLFSTLGGVFGPVGVYFGLTWLMYGGTAEYATVANGWGIPTATDIALAWLVARIVFGANHPAVNYLLLLAVADDAIGLGIIAVFYPDPAHPVAPIWLCLTGAGMAVAYGLRKANVQKWWPYIAFGGTLAWTGLILAALHPALALVAIVPFMPGPKRDTGLYEMEEHRDEHGHADHSPLHAFEHDTKTFVDFGLFFFAFANAGVAFGAINTVTWIVLCSLVIGKTIGIGFFSWLATRFGSPLPEGMGSKELILAGLIAGLGLTVALFVSGEAFPGDSAWQGPAKMGAVLSACVAFAAIVLGRIWKVKAPE